MNAELFTINPDSFDTNLYGFDVVKVSSPDPKDITCLQRDQLNLAVSSLVDQLKGQAAHYAVTRLPVSGNWELIHVLEASGFRLVDIYVSLSMQLTNLTAETTDTTTIREATDNDIPRLSELAGETFRFSRVFNDPRLDQEKGRELHRLWVANSVKGLADRVLVHTDIHNKPDGFVTLKKDKENSRLGHVPLIGVDASLVGRGIGKQLTMAGLSVLRDDWQLDEAQIETQANNIPATRTYLACGFKPKETFATLAWMNN